VVYDTISTRAATLPQRSFDWRFRPAATPLLVVDVSSVALMPDRQDQHAGRQ
jgi:hypothetical protein